MTGKMQAKDAVVDWDKVNRATEKKRTYEVLLESGGLIFKYYKPSEMKELLANKIDEERKWKRVKLMGRLG